MSLVDSVPGKTHEPSFNEASFWDRARQAAAANPGDNDFAMRAARGDFYGDPFREACARALATNPQGQEPTHSEPTVATTCFPNSSEETDASRHQESLRDLEPVRVGAR